MIANELKKSNPYLYGPRDYKVSECFDHQLISTITSNLYYETAESVVSVDNQLRGVGLRNLNTNQPRHR